MPIWGRARDFGIAGSARLDLLDMLIAEGRRQNRSFAGDPRPEAGSFFRSDHFPFAKAGVPAISWRSGRDLVNGGTERGNRLSDEYTARRYHQPDDEFDPAWDFSGTVQDAQLLHNVGYRLANSNTWPNWAADAEFRATRDQSAAERSGTAVPPPADQPAEPPKRGERG